MHKWLLVFETVKKMERTLIFYRKCTLDTEKYDVSTKWRNFQNKQY